MVEDDVRLHESTVKRAEKLAGSVPRTSPRRRSTPRNRSTWTLNIQVHPLVMREAKRLLAERPGTRLRIVDATTVMVE